MTLPPVGLARRRGRVLPGGGFRTGVSAVFAFYIVFGILGSGDLVGQVNRYGG
jgi:hypothetical protein